MKKEIKVTDEELNSIQGYLDIEQNLTLAIGDTEIQLVILQNQKEELLAQFQEVKNKQQDFSDKFTEKYGAGNVDVDTGIYTPSQENTK